MQNAKKKKQENDKCMHSKKKKKMQYAKILHKT